MAPANGPADDAPATTNGTATPSATDGEAGKASAEGSSDSQANEAAQPVAPAKVASSLAAAESKETKSDLTSESVLPAPSSAPASKVFAAASDSGSLSEFAQSAVVLRSRLEGLQANHDALLETKSSLAEEGRGLAAEIQAAEDNQNAAIEEEDFDRADALNDTIEDLKGRVSACDGRRLKVDRDLQQLASTREALRVEELEAVETVVADTRKLWHAQQGVLKEHERSTASRVRTERRRLEVQEQRVQLDEEHLELDLAEIREESDRLTKSIDEQTGGVSDEQATLNERSYELDAEITELRKELAKKEAEQAEVRAQLRTCEDRISSIRSKFAGKLSEIDDRKVQAQVVASKCEHEKAGIASGRQELDRVRSEAVAQRGNLRTQLIRHRQELDVVKQLEAALRRQVRLPTARTARLHASNTRPAHASLVAPPRPK